MGNEFKKILQADSAAVFLNPEEFGEEHVISGRKMTLVIDDNEMIEREKRQSGMRDYRQGVYNRQVLFYFLAKDFGQLPPLGRSLTLDGKPYIITDSVDEGGIYSISLEAIKS